MRGVKPLLLTPAACGGALRYSEAAGRPELGPCSLRSQVRGARLAALTRSPGQSSALPCPGSPMALEQSGLAPAASCDARRALSRGMSKAAATTKATAKSTYASPGGHLLLLCALNLVRRLASRAPESGAAEEAPMYERSEFGRRAAAGEERRVPGAASSSPAQRPPQMVLVTFAVTKVTRAPARKLLTF